MSRLYSLLAMFAALISVFATPAFAQNNQCDCVQGATRMSANDIAALLPGKTVCAVVGNNVNTTWQEFHAPGNRVVELGNSAAGDDVGSWSVNGGNSAPQSTITYNYGAGGSYTYSMCSQGNPATLYHFCGATNVTSATITAGKARCYNNP